MRCPYCSHEETQVVETRESDEGDVIRRRRRCLKCDKRFTTYERAEEVPLTVVKSNGQREPFDRSKLVAGVTAACKGRPVTTEQIDHLGEAVEDEVRLQGPEVPAQLIGVEVLDRLRRLDEVAYLRFASVYKGFDAAADFQRELVLLKKLQES